MVRRYLWLVSLGVTLTAAAPLYGQAKWMQPTKAELAMTSDPAAPGAEAVILNRSEYVDIPDHFHRVYERIKILTKQGKADYSDVAIPYEAGETAIRAIAGRTIEPNGTVVPFTGQPHDKEVLKSGGVRMMEKVFSMPEVQVGSIVEYQWEIQYDDGYIFPPHFYLQQRLYTHEAHFDFKPFFLDPNSNVSVQVPDGQGHMMEATRILSYANLPPGAKVQDLPTGTTLTVKDVPAIPREPYSPPLESFSYRLFFYYSPNYTGKGFWKSEGHAWSKAVNDFAGETDGIRQAVEQITEGASDPEAKLEKIYAAAMTVTNTDYTRALTEQEDKSEGIHIDSAADVWKYKRGTSNEITRLFIAMARAAGFEAQAMIVPERNVRVLNGSDLEWDQLTDELAIVTVNGKEMYLDPGERYCAFGKLAWVHRQVLGIRQTDHGTGPQLTPGAAYNSTVVDRRANLELGPDGTVKGSVRISMTGQVALRWRQKALSTDEQTAEKAYTNELEQEVPAGVRLQGMVFTGLTDASQPLVAEAVVSGSMGTAAGNKVIVPGTFFEAQEKPLFVAETRKNPVDLHYPFLMRDQVRVTLGAGLKVDGVPASAQMPYPQNAEFITKYAGSGSVYQEARLLAVGNTIYKAADYPQLKGFFQKLAAQDQQVVVLEKVKPGTETGSGMGE
jgi:hypothetical protein